MWSADYEDDEVRRPTHGKSFVVKEKKSYVEGKCLMVGSINLENQEYFTDDGAKSEACFTTKKVSKNIQEKARR